jgi:dTDP-glucose 4,6-dehydratase
VDIKKSNNMTKVIVTGGAGFIGSALVRYLLQNTNCQVLNIDKLTYAGHVESLFEIDKNPSYSFSKTDICDTKEIPKIFENFKPDAVFHLAAESHVDRSIDGPAEFIRTNINGTFNLLDSALHYWRNLASPKKENFRLLHVSTDEVFGALGDEGYFVETTPYSPRSPYSASKASSDHLVNAYYHTYGLPILITNCSNNYGPYQFPEKLLPVIILNALQEKPLPIYGEGKNVRDWLYVEDHVSALQTVIEKGNPGETYNIGGRNEKQNIEVVNTVCDILDRLVTNRKVPSFHNLKKFVTDRPGHDFRYAIDPTKIETEIGWKNEVAFDKGIELTIKWYIKNNTWCDSVMGKKHKLERLGLGN